MRSASTRCGDTVLQHMQKYMQWGCEHQDASIAFSWVTFLTSQGHLKLTFPLKIQGTSKGDMSPDFWEARTCCGGTAEGTAGADNEGLNMPRPLQPQWPAGAPSQRGFAHRFCAVSCKVPQEVVWGCWVGLNSVVVFFLHATLFWRHCWLSRPLPCDSQELSWIEGTFNCGHRVEVKGEPKQLLLLRLITVCPEL